jgi:hypothetical protein
VTNLPTIEHHDPIVLSKQDSQGITSKYEPQMMQPVYNILVINPPPLPLQVAAVPYATRLNDWKLRVRKGVEAGISFDPAQLADSMGYYDIAYHWRTGSLTWDIFRQRDDRQRNEFDNKWFEEMFLLAFQVRIWTNFLRSLKW